MSRDRGTRLQNALAEYLRNWWPGAESAGSGRQGRDVLHTPGVWWENKTGADGQHRPGQFMRQAVKGAAVECTVPADLRCLCRPDLPSHPGPHDFGDCHCPCHEDLGIRRSDIPVVVWWPPGVGNMRPELAVAMLPLNELMDLLVLAGYAPARKDVTE